MEGEYSEKIRRGLTGTWIDIRTQPNLDKSHVSADIYEHISSVRKQ